MRKRKNSVVVRFTDDELEKLNGKVNSSPFSREEFIRRTLENKIIHTSAPVDFPKFITELRRIGSNISEILKLARVRNFIDVKKLNVSLDELHDTQRKLWDEFYPDREEAD